MACDSCRRRKVKCNDERPTCDNCAKRSLNCTYLGEPGPAKKARLSERGTPLDGPVGGGGGPLGFSPRPPRPRSPKRPKDYDPGRLERLESLVHELYVVSRQCEGVSDSLMLGSARQVPLSSDIHDQVQNLKDQDGNAIDSPNASPQPNEQTRAYLVDTYTYYIHCQPLPLFDPTRIADFTHIGHDRLRQCIQVGVAHLNPECGKDVELVKEMRRWVFDALVEGTVSLELAQSLCVLILVSIKNEEWTQAQVALGVASRIMDELLAAIPPRRGLSNSRSLDTIRCAQSVFTLECILRRSSRDSPRLDRINQIAGVTAASKANGRSRAANSESTPSDLGVQQYCLQLFHIWSRTIAYLDTFRVATEVKPWQPHSEYQCIMQELYAFETSFAQEHRVGNLRLEDRTTGELEEHRAYWAPWFTMQFLFHAIQALANHPLIHITKVGGDFGFRPPSFSQQTADQARLHAGWVTRLVRACQEKQFQIHDPFIGHLVAAVSTVQLFWMDDRSSQVAHEAIDCHRTCEAFLAAMADRWPHLRNTVSRLEVLARSAAPSAFASSSSSEHNSRPNHHPGSGGQHHPKHSAQLELLLPMFQYFYSSMPLPDKTALHDAVPLPVSLEFLTPLDQTGSSIPASATASGGPDVGVTPIMSSGHFAAPDGGMMHGMHPHHHSALADLMPGGVNIFDTSDILNTTLLDGSLWPGQL
ncbi:hypothetical protein ANO11243_001890 [Dothideomycetidae sp. 11243]|nr:hypothetical protein ANO11243_001890 [fungal sp. No.11243]